MTVVFRSARLAFLLRARSGQYSTLPRLRHYSSEEHNSQKQQNKKLTSELVKQNVNGYVLTTFFGYVKTRILEKKFPRAMRIYRSYFEGVKLFFLDMKQYLTLLRSLTHHPDGPKSLSRQNLELFLTMPRDMKKVAPTIILSAMPIIGYFVFPLAYWYPMVFLTSHFWTIQQKSEYQYKKITERLKYNRPVLRHLQALKKDLPDGDQKEKLKTVLGQLGSGFHPTVEDILSIKDVFANPPFQFESLKSKHIKYLLKVNGVPGIFFKRRKLQHHAFLIHYMDLAIIKEGGVEALRQESICFACFLRGLNPSNLSNDEMVNWLKNWIKVSTIIEAKHISLFAHLPILLGYNHPNNWQLVYGKQAKWKQVNA